MVNLKKRPETVAKLPKHGHDLSKRILFTSSVGQLLPVLYDYLNPGDSIRVSREIFTRTQPLKTPAFVRMTEHVDYFFVPMKQINSYFGNAFYGISDFTNPNDSTSPNTWHAPQVSPKLNLSDIRTALFAGLKAGTGANSNSYFSTHYDEFGVPVESNVLRLCSMLGYSENVLQDITSIQGGTIPFVNLNLFAVYQKIFMDYYRLTDWTANNPYSYSLNSYLKNGSFQPALDSIKGSYGEGMFRLRYRPLKKDFFTNVYPSPLFANGSSVSAYSNSLIHSSSISDEGSMILSTLGVNKQFPYSVNGGVSDAGNGGYTDDTLYSHGGDEEGQDFPVTVSGLRTLFAWDRMMRITQRGGKHYDSQTLAHYGYKVPQGVSDEVYYIGSHSNRIQIGEIAATATTSGTGPTSTLGELAGRGASAQSSDGFKKFVAPCHGYFMAIYSCVPDVDYAAQGIDRINTYCSINDYYHPEFDRVGMVPMYKFEFLYNQTYARDGQFKPPVALSAIIGWNYRYYELKMKPDTVHGAFNYNLKNWVSTRNNTFLSDSNSPVFGSAGFYVSPRYLDNIFEWNFVPSSVNGVQVASTLTQITPLGEEVYYSESPVFTYDPLLHCIDFKYYKSSCMSPYGLPRI